MALGSIEEDEEGKWEKKRVWENERVRKWEKERRDGGFCREEKKCYGEYEEMREMKRMKKKMKQLVIVGEKWKGGNTVDG